MLYRAATAAATSNILEACKVQPALSPDIAVVGGPAYRQRVRRACESVVRV
jgi:hypothetical protein